MIKLYRNLFRLLTPVMLLILYLRKRKGKEDEERLPERLGYPSRPRPKGPLVWLHAVSVGESLSTLPVIDKLLSKRPDLNILVTTGTRTSANLMLKRLPEGCIHQYIPTDHPKAVHRFIKAWRPDLVFWMESELWPNLINTIHESDIPMIYLNARMSQKAYRGWKKFKTLISPLLSKVSLCFAQTPDDRDRFQALGADPVKTIGNLKYAADSLPYSEEDLDDLKSLTAGRKIWLASSTHPGEEEIIARVHTRLAKDIPNILTIIIPRHPDRGDELQKSLTKQGYTIARRSKGETISEDTQIYLADTLGELGTFYRFCELVFVGGSLTPIGGHNILEPAQLGCAIIFGHHMENFAEISASFSAAMASVQVHSERELHHQVRHMLNHEIECHQMGNAAKRIALSHRDVLERLYDEIEPYLPEEVTDFKCEADNVDFA